MMQNNKVVIVDFDGTLVRLNSFELFFKYVLICSFKKCNLYIVVFMLYIIGVRKLRFITHGKMKSKLLLFWDEKLGEGVIDEFNYVLNKHINEKVKSILEKLKYEGYKIGISSAAPVLYLLPFVKTYCRFVDFVLATPTPLGASEEWIENIGEIKKENTIEYLKRHNLVLSIVFTDHMDDIALLKINKGDNILVSPSEKTIQAVDNEGLKYEILN